jgi:putative ABC transport system substrate-binding protein
MVSRRQVLIAGALTAFGTPYAAAQARLPKVGMLSGRPLVQSVYATPVIRRLAELGYSDGKSMILAYRSTDGAIERYLVQARELIDLRCDVIFTIGSEDPVLVLKKLRSPIPTVFLAGDFDPLERKIVKSLARPDGNMTGVYAPQGVLVAKRLEVLREIVPGARRFLVLSDEFSRVHVAAARKAAAAAGVQVTITDFSTRPYRYSETFDAALQQGVQGVVLMNSPVFGENIAEINALMVKHRLPSVGSSYPGIMLRYHANVDKFGARAAEIGVRILKGEKPENIPVEQESEYILGINAKLAASMGVKIPESVMARATRIVQ